MADYWVSNERKFCDFCKCWIADNKPSIAFHENGKRHKLAVEKRLSDISRSSAKSEQEKQKFDQTLRKMEEAAMNAYARDISSCGDMTARSISTVIAASTSQGPSGSKIGPSKPMGQIDPMRLPGNSDDEDEEGRPIQRAINPESVPDPSLWVEGKSPEGYTYYWHVKTNESVWEEPKEGYMSLDEYNRINQIAMAQQEINQKKEAKNFQQNVNEEVARYNRERLKMYRRVDPQEKVRKEEKRETYKTEEDVISPDIGQWQVVEKKEEKVIDWQLPESNVYIPPVVVTDHPPEPPVKRFKEKTIESIDPELAAGTSSTFKKRKIARGNARQRLDDE